MKRFIVFISALLIFVALPAASQAFDRIEVYADSTLYGVPGFLTTIEEAGNPPNSYFLYEDAGKVVVFAIRFGGDQVWYGTPLGTYLVPPSGSLVGDSWAFLPSRFGEPQTATIENFDHRSTPAGNFITASCAVRVDTDPTHMTGYFSVADGVGIVRSFAMDYLEVSTLRSYYLVGGSGYFPLAVGNWWEYDVTYVSAVEDPPASAHMLYPCVPNPFNPSTHISFEMAAAGHAQLTVYDAAGRLVATLADEHHDAGSHQATWDGRDSSGRKSSAGVYLYRLEVGGYVETKRMTLVK